MLINQAKARLREMAHQQRRSAARRFGVVNSGGSVYASAAIGNGIADAEANAKAIETVLGKLDSLERIKLPVAGV